MGEGQTPQIVIDADLLQVTNARSLKKVVGLK